MKMAVTTSGTFRSGPCARGEPPACGNKTKTGLFFRRGTIPNSPGVTSPYSQLDTPSYLCRRFHDQEADAELHHSNMYAT